MRCLLLTIEYGSTFRSRSCDRTAVLCLGTKGSLAASRVEPAFLERELLTCRPLRPRLNLDRCAQLKTPPGYPQCRLIDVRLVDYQIYNQPVFDLRRFFRCHRSLKINGS